MKINSGAAKQTIRADLTEDTSKPAAMFPFLAAFESQPPRRRKNYLFT
jgi:hypothetical protein